MDKGNHWSVRICKLPIANSHLVMRPIRTAPGRDPSENWQELERPHLGLVGGKRLQSQSQLPDAPVWLSWLCREQQLARRWGIELLSSERGTAAAREHPGPGLLLVQGKEGAMWSSPRQRSEVSILPGLSC